MNIKMPFVLISAFLAGCAQQPTNSSEAVKLTQTKTDTSHWYRATSIDFNPYTEDLPYFEDMIAAIDAIPDYNLNTLTIDFRCGEKPIIEEVTDDPQLPIDKTSGCAVRYFDNDLITIAAERAHRNGLSVNLKPMFLNLQNKLWYKKGYEYGTLDIDVFFDGNGYPYSGYIPAIIALATHAEKIGAEYLTIGTELTNLNYKILFSPRWPEIISSIRKVYSGKLIYNTNLAQEPTVKDFRKFDKFFSQIDIIGINYYPPNALNGKRDATVKEISKAWYNGKSDGYRLVPMIIKMRKVTGKPIIMSETSFPTWDGSANWAFRHACDYKNKGKDGWMFNEGPLAAKTPSDRDGLDLAMAWHEAFGSAEWVDGVDYLFWTTSAQYYHRDPITDEFKDPNPDSSYWDCLSLLYNKNNGIKEVIRDFHTP
jgi:hypothetical protein